MLQRWMVFTIIALLTLLTSSLTVVAYKLMHPTKSGHMCICPECPVYKAPVHHKKSLHKKGRK